MEPIKAILLSSRRSPSLPRHALLLNEINRLLPSGVTIRSLRAGKLLLDCQPTVHFLFSQQAESFLISIQQLAGGEAVERIVLRKC